MAGTNFHGPGLSHCSSTVTGKMEKVPTPNLYISVTYVIRKWKKKGNEKSHFAFDTCLSEFLVTLICLSVGAPETINFPFVPN